MLFVLKSWTLQSELELCSCVALGSYFTALSLGCLIWKLDVTTTVLGNVC